VNIQTTTSQKRKWLRRSLTAVGALGAMLAATVAYALLQAEHKQHRQVALHIASLQLPEDSASLDRGRYLYLSRGCIDCHGSNGAGRVLIDDGKGMKVRGPNISQGAATVANYRVDDWVRIIRHGVKPSGEPALIMPSEDYNRLSNADLAAMIAFLKTLPSAQGGPAIIELPLLVRALYGLGIVKDAAEKIDHSLPPSPPVPADTSVTNGAYVAAMCIGCHGPGYSGGKIPGTPPEWPAASNLTPGPGSAMSNYRTAEQFVAMMHSGKRPDGSAVSQVMPFTALKQMNETDLLALYSFLQTLAPKPAGQR
jgi:mono/diheme cytochrome c family protein